LPRTDLSGVKPVIFSCEGFTLTNAERAFFKQENPFGFILFARNIDDPDQVRALIVDFRLCVGRNDAPVLVDQEGGRVQRFKEPHWFKAPSFGTLGKLYDLDATKGARATILATQLIAADLQNVGVTVNCSPCLDLSLGVTSSVIGDRSFHENPDVVAHLAKIVVDEYLNAGITPVIKHMPGHGRGSVDSHLELPKVSTSVDDLAADFLPFKELSSAPWGMTAHIVFEDVDPEYPGTQSKTVINDIIRGEIGFDGVLLTDDLNMNALSGSLGMRTIRAQEAGIDIILHCSGKLDEMQEVMKVCLPMTEDTMRRIDTQNSQNITQATNPRITENIENLKEELATLLALV